MHDNNGVLLFGGNSIGPSTGIYATTAKFPDIFPFELKLLFLSMDHQVNCRFFQQCLKDPNLFEKQGSHLDLKKV